MKYIKTILVLGIFIILAASAGATVPRLLTLQGRLTDPTSGNPVEDSTYMMVFGIYESEVNGSALWAETTSVPVQAGTFNVYLHPPDPIFPPDPVFNDTGVRYLGIQVPPDPEMTPRIRLASVPYSFKVRTVEGALGGNIFGDLQLHSTLTVGDLAGDVGKLEITDGASTKIVADGFSGRVGIGTTSPFSPIHISGPFAEIRLDDTDNAVEGVVGAFGAGVVGVLSVTSHPVILGVNGSEKVRVQSDGNVGIGTTSPQGALDVSSTTGALIVPRMTTAQRDAFTAVDGMIIYNTDAAAGGRFEFRENGAWVTK